MATLVDTGPLVALLVANDGKHETAVTLFERAPKPWITCEAVISETIFLMARTKRGPDSVLALLERGAIAIGYSLRGEELLIASLLRKYRSVPMSFADACLVRMSEQNPHAGLLTFDSDFSIYRRRDRRLVPRQK